MPRSQVSFLFVSGLYVKQAIAQMFNIQPIYLYSLLIHSEMNY